MDVTNLNSLRQFLDMQGTGAKKSLSQNFLIDRNIINKIISAASVSEKDVVVEIGPGPGALTYAILKTGATLIAIEKDRILAQSLARFQQEFPGKLHILCEDILDVAMDSILPKFLQGKKAKLVANLPYQLTSSILGKFLPLENYFSSLTVMVQDEVAIRMVAREGGRDYSSLSVLCHFYSDPHYAFFVSNKCFYPAPKVNSAVVHLELQDKKLVSNIEKFFELVHTSFQQRRKMLRQSLKGIYPSNVVVAALEQIGLKETSRPEEIPLEKLTNLFEILYSR